MSKHFEMRNVSEDMIDLYIDDCIRKSESCLCERCRADIRAFALNNFPPRYVVTEFGDLLTRALSLSNQYQADIITVLMHGIMLVKEKPRHTPADLAAVERVMKPESKPDAVPAEVVVEAETELSEEYTIGKIDESEIEDFMKEFEM